MGHAEVVSGLAKAFFSSLRVPVRHLRVNASARLLCWTVSGHCVNRRLEGNEQNTRRAGSTYCLVGPLGGAISVRARLESDCRLTSRSQWVTQVIAAQRRRAPLGPEGCILRKPGTLDTHNTKALSGGSLHYNPTLQAFHQLGT